MLLPEGLAPWGSERDVKKERKKSRPIEKKGKRKKPGPLIGEGVTRAQPAALARPKAEKARQNQKPGSTGCKKRKPIGVHVRAIRSV